MCGVNVLDKGCGGITVQVYVGCRVFEVAKSYLCVSVPVLDDDCVAFVSTATYNHLAPQNNPKTGEQALD